MRYVQFALETLLALAIMVTPLIAFSHPGHGTTDAGSARHMLEPAHVVWIAFGAVLAASMTIESRRKVRARS